MKIAIASDHGGIDLKSVIFDYAGGLGHEITDLGPFSTDSVDYPDFAKKVADQVVNQTVDFGILICRSGIGMSIAANKVNGVRAALCLFPKVGNLARQHNDANVLCLSNDFTEPETAKKIFLNFSTAVFEAGRHAARVNKMTALEE